jgi:hypothetical protein
MLKTKRTEASRTTPTFEELNVLMEAVALIIARRQMRLHWREGKIVGRGA